MSAGSGRRPFGVAAAGFGWMGRVHTQAYARVLHHLPELPPAPELVAVADEVPGRAEPVAAQFGLATATRDWRELAGDPAVEAVSVTANFLHREIGVAMARAGKHVWIEKAVGLTTGDARAVAGAVRGLVAGGRLGAVTHARFRLFSDYAAHPEGALTWRYERVRGGSGVLGDLYVGPGHGEYAASQPGAAVAMGFDDLKVMAAAGSGTWVKVATT